MKRTHGKENDNMKSPSTMSPCGMVTSPSAISSEIGAAFLKSGGNAVEAAIAVALSLGVTYPHFCGLGGDAFLLIAHPGDPVLSISGIGQAAMDTARYKGSIPQRGPSSMLTTAGALSAFEQAFEYSRRQLNGQKTWQSLFDPSISLAKEGFEVSESERFWLRFRQQESASMPDVFRYFAPEGLDALASQQRVHRPALAQTLARVGRFGAKDFYHGDLAQELAAHFQAVGSPLSVTDLAQTRARVEPAIHVRYRQGTLYAHPPPTQGVTTLEIMGILNQFDLKSLKEGSADHYHLMVEAIKQAFMDRNRFVSDPEWAPVPVDQMLSDDHLKARAQSIDLGHALDWPQVFQQGDTVFVGVEDASGVSVSLLATVYYDWGSGVVLGDSGLLWHNRGAAFSLNAQHPNVLKPGKRPFHTLNPGLYLKDNGEKIIYGTQGADGQPQTLAQILTRMIDFKMLPHDALSAPRFLLGKTFSSSTESLKIEQNVGAQVLEELKAKGHLLETLTPQNPLMGHPGSIVVQENASLSGAHDPRSDGLAIRVECTPKECP